MRRIRLKLWGVFSLFLLSFCLSGCGGETSETSSAPSPPSENAKPRQTLHSFLLPEASGSDLYENELASIDASHTSDGYVMIRYSGSCDKAKIQITDPGSVTYTSTLLGSEYETFPLSGGNGSYHIDVLEHVSDDLYALIFSQDLSVSVGDEFLPFLYPNQYAWYTSDSDAVQLGIELSDTAYGDLDYVEKVYHYIIENIAYDTNLAENIPLDYIPDIDLTLQNGSGICFDYAALMTSLLRSQGIPTRLEVGYSGRAYHAWISVYLAEIGWVDNIIEFNGHSWSLMDPTLAAGNDSRAVEKYIGDGSNYTVKYYY